MRTRVGIMGCANIARRAMAPALLQAEGLELAATASREESRARQFAAAFGGDALEGYARLLEHDSIEAVYIPLPTGLHGEWIEKALRAGKHVLAEKSFAPDLETAQRLLALARQQGLLVMENFMFPLHPQFRWVRQQVGAGAVGDFQLFRATFAFPPRPQPDIRYQPELGGGALFDAGAYVVKAAQVFLGHPLEVVSASLVIDPSLGVDVRGQAHLLNEAGQSAQVAWGFDSFYQCRFSLLGSKGKLSTDRAFTAPPGYAPRAWVEQQDLRQEFTLPPANQYLLMWTHFAELIEEGGAARHEYEAIERQAALLEAIRTQARVFWKKA